jgi:hypothetical protein
VINRFVAPFSGQAHEDGLEVVSDITDNVVCRHVYDAPTVTDSTLTVLQHCLQRMVQERTFDANSYRAGEINSRTLWYFRCCWCCHLQLIRGAAHLEINFAVNSRSRVPVLQLSRGAMASHFCHWARPFIPYVGAYRQARSPSYMARTTVWSLRWPTRFSERHFAFKW